MIFFHRNIKNISLRLVWKYKTPRRPKTILRRKDIAGGITLSVFKPHYKASVTNRVCYWHKNIHISQQKKVKIPEINPLIHVQLILGKGTKSTQLQNDNLFNNGWEYWLTTCRSKIFDHYCMPHTKIDSEWIKNLNTKTETLKLPEENTRENILDICLEPIFLI